MSYRIVQKGNRFFPEKKFLLWWISLEEIGCSSVQEASNIIEDCILWGNPPRVVWQSDRQEKDSCQHLWIE